MHTQATTKNKQSLENGFELYYMKKNIENNTIVHYLKKISI